MFNAAELRSSFLSPLLLLLHNNVHFHRLCDVHTFRAAQGREAVFSRIWKRHSMCFGNLEFQDAILHRQNNRFYTRMSLISLLCGFAKEQILSKPEYLFFVLSSKKKSRLSKCIWGKRWKVWKSHHSAFTHLLKSNTQTQGLVDSLL